MCVICAICAKNLVGKSYAMTACLEERQVLGLEAGQVLDPLHGKHQVVVAGLRELILEKEEGDNLSLKNKKQKNLSIKKGT